MARNRARAAAHEQQESAPEAQAPLDTPDLQLVAMREHSLLSLFELSHELTVVLDAAGIADLGLYNLMGHLGTAQAAMFLEHEYRPGSLYPIRSHGMRPEVAHALAESLEAALPEYPRSFSTPLRLEDAGRVLDPSAIEMAEANKLALIAPLVAGQRAIGFVVLGRRARGEFSDLDLDMLNASLGMVGVAFENRRLYSRLEDQNRGLAHANEELRELDRLKSEFLQSIHHELRTPLAVIIGGVDCLRMEDENDPRRSKLLKGILDQASRLRDMVQTLLDFSATLDGSMHLQIDDFELKPFLENFFASRRDRVAETHPDFGLIAEWADVPARADRDRVGQVLDLLLDNAVKFTEPGTRIEIRMLEPRFQDAWSSIEVSDNGPGIPSEFLPVLFRPFWQGDSSMTREVGGLGMGLATAFRLAERMGARLLVDSEVGVGSKFTLQLPRP